MKKLITTLILILTLSVVGGLCNTLAHLNDLGTVSVEEVSTNQFPEQLPEIMLDPMLVARRL
jgi:hypothetical protein